jgi:hypothetical protein
MRSILETLIISQTTREGKDAARDFMKKHPVNLKMTGINAFETLEQNLKFIEKNREFLKNYK